MNVFILKLASVLGVAVLALPQIAVADCVTELPSNAPDTRYAIQGPTVTDMHTGLVWLRCSQGQTGDACTGTVSNFTWQQALQQAQQANASATAGFSDWRLPNRAELASLVERQCANPAINLTVFPGTPGRGYWSSSPFARIGGLAWFVDFNAGDVGPLLKSDLRVVRLVRAGKQ